MWNYIFYKAYLEFKDETEYNGNESFIYNKIQSLDIGWFPIKKARSVVDEEDEEERRDKMTEEIYRRMREISEVVDKAYKQVEEKK